MCYTQIIQIQCSIEEERKKNIELFFKQFVILFIEIHNNKGFIKIPVVVTD